MLKKSMNMGQDRSYNVLALLISILAFLNSITAFSVVPWISIGLAGAVSILFSGVNALIFVVLVFVVATRFVYTVIHLYGFLRCLFANCK